MNLRERATLVDVLGSSLMSGGHSLEVVPSLLKKLLYDGEWKEFETKRGQYVTYTRFEDFVTTPPLAGLGATIELVEAIVSRDTEALGLLMKELRRPNGRPNKTLDIIKSSSDKHEYTSGTSKAYALQKLEDDGHVDLLARVHTGELSANKAMKQAGYRRPKIAVSLDDAASAARTLHTHATTDFLLDLIKHLLEFMPKADETN